MSLYCKGEICERSKECLRAKAWREFAHKDIPTGDASDLWMQDEQECIKNGYGVGVFPAEPRPRVTHLERGTMPYSIWSHLLDDAIRSRYDKSTTESLAAEFGEGYYTIARRAARMGIKKTKEFMQERWSAGGKIGGKFSKLPKRMESTDAYMKAHFHDTSNAELATLFGVDVKTVRRWARKLGLQKSEEFMRKARTRSSHKFYTQEYLEWRRKRIAEVYPDADKEGLRRLADELGISICTLQKLAGDAGIRFSEKRRREAIEEGHKKLRTYTPEIVEAIREYYPDHTCKECAEKFGLTLGVLKQIAVKNGMKKNPKYLSRIRKETAGRRH